MQGNRSFRCRYGITSLRIHLGSLGGDRAAGPGADPLPQSRDRWAECVDQGLVLGKTRVAPGLDAPKAIGAETVAPVEVERIDAATLPFGANSCAETPTFDAGPMPTRASALLDRHVALGEGGGCVKLQRLPKGVEVVRGEFTGATLPARNHGLIAAHGRGKLALAQPASPPRAREPGADRKQVRRGSHVATTAEPAQFRANALLCEPSIPSERFGRADRRVSSRTSQGACPSVASALSYRLVIPTVPRRNERSDNLTESPVGLGMASNRYTTTEAARRLDVTPRTILRWIAAGTLAGDRTAGGNGSWRVDAIQVESLASTKRMTETPSLLYSLPAELWDDPSFVAAVVALDHPTIRGRTRGHIDWATRVIDWPPIRADVAYGPSRLLVDIANALLDDSADCQFSQIARMPQTYLRRVLLAIEARAELASIEAILDRGARLRS